jgi:ABC-type transporter Mla maintaining outer membrane lipid asymmetry permease subunit MlaE
VIANISCYQGYHASGGAVGVGATVRRTAVQTLVSIIVVDYALSTFSEALRGLVAGWVGG